VLSWLKEGVEREEEEEEKVDEEGDE